MVWYRMHGEVLSDWKLRRVAMDTGETYATIVGAWTLILGLASESPVRGRLLLADDKPIEGRHIAPILGMSDAATDAIVNGMEDIGLLSYDSDGEVLIVTAWDDRQYESDSSTERVRKHREKQVKRYRNVPETPQNRTEQNISEQSKAEQAHNSLKSIMMESIKAEHHQMLDGWIEDYGAQEVWDVLEIMKAKGIARNGALGYLRVTLSGRAKDSAKTQGKPVLMQKFVYKNEKGYIYYSDEPGYAKIDAPEQVCPLDTRKKEVDPNAYPG